MDNFLALCSGFIIGVIFCVFLGISSDSILKKARAEIAICEQHLPRDQHCELTAVPTSVEK